MSKAARIFTISVLSNFLLLIFSFGSSSVSYCGISGGAELGTDGCTTLSVGADGCVCFLFSLAIGKLIHIKGN